MRENFKLIIVTVIFVLAGLVLSFFALQDSGFIKDEVCEVDGVEYEVGKEVSPFCFCGSGGIVECLPQEVDDEENGSLDTSELNTAGMEFEYSYLRGFGNGQESLSVPPLSFSSVGISDGSLVVVLENMQLCPESSVAPEQFGFYEYNGVLKLYSMVRASTDSSSVSCVVQLKYVFEDFEVSDDIEIAFVNEAGVSEYANICAYNGRVYSESDVFRNVDGLICTCENGQVDCVEELLD